MVEEIKQHVRVTRKLSKFSLSLFALSVFLSCSISSTLMLNKIETEQTNLMSIYVATYNMFFLSFVRLFL